MYRASKREPGYNKYFDPSNVSIVAYRKMAAKPHDERANSFVAPHWLWSRQGTLFRGLERFANVIVDTPNQPGADSEWRASTLTNPKPFRPFLS